LSGYLPANGFNWFAYSRARKLVVALGAAGRPRSWFRGGTPWTKRKWGTWRFPLRFLCPKGG